MNKAVRLAGTVCEDESDQERIEFDLLCEKCHLHFPDIPSQLKDILEKQVDIV